MNAIGRLMALCLLLGTALPIAAEEPIILTVHRADGVEVEFDFAQIEAMEPTTIVTHTKWTDGLQHFTGVRLSTLLEAAGAAPASTVQAVALNDYAVEIPWTDAQDFPVIVAYRRNGERMVVRDKGPLWIIYPQDDFEILRTWETESKMIWQLRQLKVDR
jgi:hypothetical protein